MLDLPAFGSPTKPTSAMSLSSSRSSKVSPGRPPWNCLGEVLRDERKWKLPLPPMPPLAKSTRSLTFWISVSAPVVKL